LFVFFKQKTAYEIRLSLVGSEMCIRDRAWADNQGGYFDFRGAFEGDKRIFMTQPREINGNTAVQRMVFYDIKKDSFSWDWESSSDEGETWNLNWRISYTRAD